jgi:UPF0755 protein
VTKGLRYALLALAVLVAGASGFFVSLLSPVQRGNPYAVSFVVLPGESVQEIGSNLQNLGLIRERHAFEVLVRLRGESRELKAGPYRARSDEWAWEILGRMVQGEFQDTSVTVPEGLWITEVAELVDPVVEGGADSLMVAIRDTTLLRSLGIPGETAEGYLFPDTYRLILPTPPSALVRQMIRTFLQVWNRDLREQARENEMTRHEIVTLASIVEAEAQVADERSRIAAVYLNRLELGLPLQADPTVHYALGERRQRTLYDDLQVPSPYNTYLQPGLPPGPICNPGLSALRAVLWPLEDCKDLYFVALGNGTHLFATDFAGHLRNRRLVRQQRLRAPD